MVPLGLFRVQELLAGLDHYEEHQQLVAARERISIRNGTSWPCRPGRSGCDMRMCWQDDGILVNIHHIDGRGQNLSGGASSGGLQGAFLAAGPLRGHDVEHRLKVVQQRQQLGELSPVPRIRMVPYFTPSPYRPGVRQWPGSGAMNGIDRWQGPGNA
jgi:hypothetical protein